MATDPCTVDPSLPGCLPVTPTPVPIPDVVANFPWTEVITYLLAALVAILAAFKLFGILDILLANWRLRTSDRKRFGHSHKDHHKKKKRKS